MNPDSTDIFEDNLIHNFYLSRSGVLEDVCLHDFVSCQALIVVEKDYTVN